MEMDTPSIYRLSHHLWLLVTGGQKPISAKSLSLISFLAIFFYVSSSDLRVCWGWWFTLWFTTKQKFWGWIDRRDGTTTKEGVWSKWSHSHSVISLCWCECKCKELERGGVLSGASLCKVRANPDIPASPALGWGGCVYCGSGPECAPVPTRSCRNVTGMRTYRATSKKRFHLSLCVVLTNFRNTYT